MRDATFINLSELWTECCICGEETPPTHAVAYCCGPTHDEIGAESSEYPGHVVGGMPACKSCHDRHYTGWSERGRGSAEISEEGEVMQPTMGDTWWTEMGWRVALQFLLWGLKIAPPGDARGTLIDLHEVWIKECTRQWRMRYGEQEGT